MFTTNTNGRIACTTVAKIHLSEGKDDIFLVNISTNGLRVRWYNKKCVALGKEISILDIICGDSRNVHMWLHCIRYTVRMIKNVMAVCLIYNSIIDIIKTVTKLNAMKIV